MPYPEEKSQFKPALDWRTHRPPGRLDLLVEPVGRMMRKVLLVDRLNQLYAEALKDEAPGSAFQKLLDHFEIGYRVTEAELSHIPRSGPVVVSANHPFGFAEGFILGALLTRVRSDVKIMVNAMLTGASELEDHLVFVDPFQSRSANCVNRAPLRNAVRWLRSGGMLVVFPSGEVSHLDLGHGGISDPPWNRTVAGLVRLSRAAALPVYFTGSNGLSFQLLGVVHPRLRTLRLPNELLALRGRQIEVRISTPIPAETLLGVGDDEAITNYLRSRTYVLAARNSGAPRSLWNPRKPREIVPETPRELLLEEISKIPADRTLARFGSFSALLTSMRESPQLIREVGRLREVTFRHAAEGTGKPTDLDRFDEYYRHLVLWHPGDQQVAGAYRMASTAEVLPRFGIPGLYTAELFRYRPQFFERIGDAIELGRSFVRLEYQRSLAPLAALWKGIGAYVAARPQHRVLFGAVSISGDYRPASRQLLAASLGATASSPELSDLVEPRRRFRAKQLFGVTAGFSTLLALNLDELSAVISDIEADGKTVPVLIRQYLKLGGRVLGFHLDSDFSNTLDGLMVVDLAHTTPALLERYLTKEGLARWLAFQRG